MKRIYYLLAFIAVATAFTACNPLDKTYKELGDIPKPTAPPAAPIAVTITLTAADYGLLPSSNYAKTQFGFKTLDDAKTGVAAILTAKYPTAVDKSSAIVTYGIANPVVKLADSVFSHVSYTPTTADYYSVTVKYTDFSTAQAISFLNLKYPTPSPNQIVVLNYTYYESGVTTSSGTPNTVHTYVYLNGVWTKIYTVSPAQYASVNRGLYNQFTATDDAMLSSYLNQILKADAGFSASAKYGNVVYVSFNYYQSSSSAADYKATSQRVIALTFDGANWVTTPIASSPLTFLKTNGAWVADNTVNYTLVANDYKYMGNTTTAGSVAGRANIVSYPDFNISATTDPTYWSDTDIQAAIITFLVHTYPNAVANQKFNITYAQYYKGATTNVTKTFQYNGSTFVFVQ